MIIGLKTLHYAAPHRPPLAAEWAAVQGVAASTRTVAVSWLVMWDSCWNKVVNQWRQSVLKSTGHFIRDTSPVFAWTYWKPSRSRKRNWKWKLKSGRLHVVLSHSQQQSEAVAELFSPIFSFFSRKKQLLVHQRWQLDRYFWGRRGVTGTAGDWRSWIFSLFFYFYVGHKVTNIIICQHWRKSWLPCRGDQTLDIWC